MREIKFRGKQLNNGKWAYGGIEFQGEIVYIAQQIKGGITCVQVDPATVGQYTGLKDKNGTKIYEGDIVRFKTKRFHNKRRTPNEKPRTKWFTSAVVYEDCSFVISETQENDSTLWSNEENAIEIIGNTTDTPHLLDPSAR